MFRRSITLLTIPNHINNNNNDLMDSNFYKKNIYTEVSGKKLNDANEQKTFYKFINKNMVHHDFKYMEGLNVDTRIFDPTGRCDGGGLYFTSINKLFRFKNFGEKIYKINIPNSARCYLEDDKIKCDKIIIKYFDDIYNLKNYDICIEAVKENGHAIKYIDNKILEKNIDICIEAVKQNGDAIYYIDNKILEKNIDICIGAVKQNGCAICHIDNKTLEKNIDICIEAVKRDGNSIRYIDNKILEKNIDICIEAVKEDGRAIFYIDRKILEKNIDICIEAVKENDDVIKYMTPTILYKILKTLFLNKK